MIVTLAMEIYALSTALEAVGEFEKIYPLLDASNDDSNPPAYANLETLMNEEFNTIFFGATTNCGGELRCI